MSTINLQNWRQLSSIQIGGVICLPVIMIGQTLSQTYGFSSAVAAILLGNFLLLLLGFISVKMSHEKRKTTMENAIDFFGEKGVVFFALTMGLSLLGWFAIQLNMMSLSVLDLLSVHSARPLWLLILNITLGLLITAVALNGLKALNLFANVSLPLLFLTLSYALYTVEKSPSISARLFSIGGTSLVIAMAITLVIDFPTFFRHARTAKDGYISNLIIFGLALPLLEIIGVYLAEGKSDGSILDVLKRDNGPLWNMWIASFLILAGWTTNNLNLYSGVMCLTSVLKNISERLSTLCFGILGTFLSCFNLLNHIEIVLDVMGIFIASMGAVILTRYLLAIITGRKMTDRDHRLHLLAWSFGIILGLFSLFGFSLTSLSVLDAMIGASIGTLLTMTRKEIYEKAHIG